MMKGAVPNILGAIGHTPIVKLERLGKDVQADIYVKCEYLNPGGSMKDRMALCVIDHAERRGELKPDDTIIEATSGNTGAAIAMIAAVRGYKSIFVVPDKTSPEKISSLRAWGSKVVVCPSAVEPEDPRSYHRVAKRLAEESPHSFYANQYHNPDNPRGHYEATGPEIWDQTQGQVDVLVTGLGTGGTLMGAGLFLKEKKPELQLVGIDPVGSIYYDFVKGDRVTQPFKYKVEGIGEDFFPSTIDFSKLDEIVRVDDKECFLMTRDLVRLEGLYVGGSSGGAVAGALKYAQQTQRKENILVLLPDASSNYLSTIFDDDWMREHGFLGESHLGVVGDLLKHKTGDIITASSHDRVRDVISRMKAHSISQLPVTDEGKLVGAVTEVDLLRYLVSGEQSLDSPVGPLVENDYATVSPRTSIENLQSLFLGARMAVVTDDDTIIGVVTKIDLIDHLARIAS